MSRETTILIDAVLAGSSFYLFIKNREPLNLLIGLAMAGFILGFFMVPR